jgi:predicted nucleic acid-binding protein
MIVVSDASPLNILARIDCIEVLPLIFGTVYVPPAVLNELSTPTTPEPVRKWLAAKPSWLRVEAPRHLDPSLKLDDAGEAEAISLALQLHADFLLADDRKARKTAQARGLKVTGAVGVLELAAARRLIDLPESFSKLRGTDFFIDPMILESALARDAARRPPRQ